jgi:pimeloyl-ACP methyl ester carboxylesterase
MDDADVERIKSLVPHCQYSRIDSGHIIHQENPKIFILEVITFAESLS